MSLFLGPYGTVKVTVSASSNYSGNYPAVEAFNGSTNDRETDRWVSENKYSESTGYPDSGAGEWYQFEFEEPKRIEKVQVYTGNLPERAPKKITFYSSPTGNFTGEEINCGSVEFDDTPNDNALTDWYEIPTPIESKYLRLVINKLWPSSNGYAVVPEWQLWDSDETSNDTEFGDANFSPTNAFDNNLVDGNASDGAWYSYFSGAYQTTGKIGQNFDTDKKVIKKYRIYSNISSTAYNPDDWTFEGSNDSTDGLTDGTWDILDTQTDMSVKLGIAVWNDFAIPNIRAYQWYRLNISANGGDATYLIIQDIEMLSYVSDLTDTIWDHYSDCVTGPATNMSDNDIATYVQNFTYLAIELPVVRKVYGLRLGLYNSAAKTELVGKVFQGSNDSTDGSDGTWTTLLTFTAANLGSVGSIPKWSNLMDLEEVGEYQWYRITGNANNDNVVTQWEMFDAPFDVSDLTGTSLYFDKSIITENLVDFPVAIKLGDNGIDVEEDSYENLLIDNFLGTVLDNAVWDTFIESDASVTVNNQLELNNISTDAHSGAKIFTRDRFNASGIYRLTFDWKPHVDHSDTAAMPGICFCSPTATRESQYGERQFAFIKCFLANQTDTTQRTELSICDNDNGSGDWHGTELTTKAIDIDETIFHSIIIDIDWDNKMVVFDLDDGTYNFSATISDSTIIALTDQFVLEIATSDYVKDNTEIFKNVVFKKLIDSAKKLAVTMDLIDSETKLLIHSDTTDGSTTFIDSSNSEHTITANGDVHHEVDQKKFGDTSIYFDGTDDCLGLPIATTTSIQNSAFTIDCWVYITSSSTHILFCQNKNVDYGHAFLRINSSDYLEFLRGSAHPDPITLTGSTKVSFNTWHHVALIVDGVTWKLYLDGMEDASITESSYWSSLTGMRIPEIGRSYFSSGSEYNKYFTGYIDEFRISTIARWTSDFTPPHAPYSSLFPCFVETECWEVNNKVIHAKIPFLVSGKNNEIKVFFDSGQFDNLDYVGETGSTPAQQVWDDNFCYDKNTEVLTDCGWKLFKDLDKTEQILTLNPITQEMEYQIPTAYIKYHYLGKLFTIQKSQQIDLAVIPEHNMYVSERKSNWNNFNLKKAQDCFDIPVRYKKDGVWVGIEKDVFSIPKCMLWYNTSNQYAKGVRKEKECPEIIVNMDIWVEFLGYFLSEGCTIYKDTGEKYKYAVNISQSSIHPENREKIRVCLQKMPFIFSENDTGFTINSKQLASYTRQFGTQEFRYIPKDIKQLSKRQLIILFNALMLGDGASNGTLYSTISKQLADDFQELLLKIGAAGNVYLYNKGRKTPIYTVSVITGKKYGQLHPYIWNDDKTGRTACNVWEEYNDLVYSVDVPNHIIYVRRNGKGVWSGNCAVYHMAQDPSGDADCILDSTSNILHGISEGTMLTEDLVDGLIGKALDFNGSSQSILIVDSEIAPSVLQDIGNNDNYTIEYVSKTNVTTNSGTYWRPARILFELRQEKGSGAKVAFSLGYESSKLSVGRASNYTSTSERETSNSDVTVNVWVVNSIVVTDDQIKFFLDGSLDATKEYTTCTGDCSVAAVENSNLRIMARSKDTGASSDWIDGSLAELRLSQIERSSVWFKATNASLRGTLFLNSELFLPILLTKKIQNIFNSILTFGGV